MADEDERAELHLESLSPASSSTNAVCWNGPSKRSSSCKAAAAASAEAVATQQQTTPTDSNSNPISPVASDEEEEEEEGLEHCQSESYHWCEEDSDLTSSEAVTTTASQTDKTQATSSGEQQLQQLEYVEMAKKVDTNLAHIDIEDFKSADLFRSESLLIEYQERCSQSQDDCSLTDCGSICKSGPLFSPQRNVPKMGIQKSQKGSHLPDFSTDSLMLERCEEDEDDECWLLQEQTDCGGGQTNSSTGPNNLCRTNVTNYTLAWSSTSVGTDQDLDYNEPGTSSSGSEQSHWSSSGSGGGRIAPPPIPPWPELRAGPTLQCWLNQPSLPSTPKKTAAPIKSLTSQSTKTKPPPEDNPTLSDQDNGNGCKSSSRSSSRQRPVFTSKMEPNSATGKGSSTSPGTAATTGLSLLQIYMRQRSQTSMERETTHQRSGNIKDEEIASGGGEGWVEEYPSSADEKLGLESISSSLADAEDEDGDDDDTSNSDEDDHCDNNVRSLTLTDVSDDIEQTSMQIDAVPFNSAGQQQASSPSSSLDKLIAKIKPFELGLSPASIEEHWNFESRLHGRGASTAAVEAQDKGCQVSPPIKHEETGTCTDPQKQQAYLIFPSYSLPDLSFLKKHDYTWIGEALLSPQDLPAAPITPIVQQKHFDDLKRRQLGHVKDWESLKVLLPEEIRQKISFASRPQRPKSCDHSVKLRESKKSSSVNRPLGYRAASACYPESTGNYTLPTVPQSPTSEGPPPLPKRTASLPHSPAATPRQLHRRNAEKAHNTTPPISNTKPKFGYTIRKTVSFGEHLGSGGVIRTPHSNQYKRPLSLSHWSGAGSLDIDSPHEPSSNTSSFNLEQKQELVQGVSVASAQLCKIAHQSLMMYSRQDTDADDITQSKLISRCLTGQLSPAIYQLLSDGLLPNVNTFFGSVNNSVWRVVEASVKKGPMLPWIEELVFCLNSEESLPEGPVRFGVFITELVNMGGLDWWLDNLSAKETILRRHYAPNGFLYLCHTSTRPLMEEMMASLRPLASLPFDSPGKPTSTAPTQSIKTALTPATTPSNTTNKTILKSPNRTPVKQHSQPLQRPVSYVQNSPSHKPQYRRTQSQHSGLSSPSKRSPQQQQQQDSNKTESNVEEFSSLKQKWESLSKTTTVKAASDANVPVKSRIPRPVFRFNK